MSRVDRTRRGEVDLRQIWVHVAENNFSAADRLIDRLEKAIALLAENPRMGEAIGSAVQGVRQFSVGSYVVFFRPLPDGIRLIRVLHASRNIRPLIDELDEGEL